MSVLSWTMRYGPGSVGRSASKIAKAAIEHLPDPAVTTTDYFYVFAALIKVAAVKRQQAYDSDLTLLVEKSYGCLAVQVFILLMQDENSRKALAVNEQTTDAALLVIYEAINREASQYIRFRHQEYAEHCMDYLLYTKFSNTVVTKPFDMNKTEYLVEIIDDSYTINERFYTYKQALQYYDGILPEGRHNRIVTLYEFYGDKYVYPHMCNNAEYRVKMFDDILRHRGELTPLPPTRSKADAFLDIGRIESFPFEF